MECQHCGMVNVMRSGMTKFKLQQAYQAGRSFNINSDDCVDELISLIEAHSEGSDEVLLRCGLCTADLFTQVN